MSLKKQWRHTRIFIYTFFLHYICTFYNSSVCSKPILLKLLSVLFPSIIIAFFFHFSAFCWHICKSKFSFFHSVWRSENLRFFCRRKVIVIGSLVDLPHHLKLPENFLNFWVNADFVKKKWLYHEYYYLKVN